MADAEWLESMRDEAGISVLWEGHYAGIGWLLFEDAGELEEWLRWQVSPQTLGNASSWGDAYEKLRALEKRVTPLCTRAGRDVGSTYYLDGVRMWIRSLEKLLRGSTLGASHAVHNFEELMQDPKLVSAFNEYFERDSSKAISPRSDLAGFQKFLVRRYGHPGAWVG